MQTENWRWELTYPFGLKDEGTRLTMAELRMQEWNWSFKTLKILIIAKPAKSEVKQRPLLPHSLSPSQTGNGHSKISEALVYTRSTFSSWISTHQASPHATVGPIAGSARQHDRDRNDRLKRDEREVEMKGRLSKQLPELIVRVRSNFCREKFIEMAIHLTNHQ